MQKCELGMVGLGVMGRNLLLNMADHGFSVAGYDQDPGKAEALLGESEKRNIQSAETIESFIGLLRPPRAVMMLVPAGLAVDTVIETLQPHLETGDVIVDGGNSHFRDTERRARDLMANGIQYLGVGISGGEEGARRGPSVMPGGPKDAYERVRVIFESVAAKVKEEPCVAYLGPGAAGHFVKMVHNGIEYGLMQLIAESYDLMKRGLGLTNDELHDVYHGWNQGELAGYLVEITSEIFNVPDERTGRRLIDQIRAVARQKGTGMWTSESAMELQVPTPTIDTAVAMRDLSAFERERGLANGIYSRAIRSLEVERTGFLEELKDALYVAMIITYAQGLSLLRVAGERYGYPFELEEIARIWRGGCIIRAGLLEDIREAFRARRDLPNLLLDSHLSETVMKHQEGLRRIIGRAAKIGVPVPGLMVSLGFLDAYRSSWSPANLIQAQRDYFGSHTYERIDANGTFHTQWEKG